VTLTLEARATDVDVPRGTASAAQQAMTRAKRFVITPPKGCDDASPQTSPATLWVSIRRDNDENGLLSELRTPCGYGWGGRLLVDEISAIAQYLPRVLQSPLPMQPWWEEPGTLLFSDVSGFTVLSEKLARHGKVGAEEMVNAISTVFTPLLDEISRYDGDVLKFGGDALLTFFSGEQHELRAAACAHRMRQVLRTQGRVRTPFGAVPLGMSQGLHSGTFAFFVCGNDYADLIATGPAVSATLAMETAAERGEVLLSEDTAQALPARLAVRHQAFRRADNRHTHPVQNPGQLGGLLVDPNPRLAHALNVGDDPLPARTVLEVNDDLALLVIVLPLVALDIPLLGQDLYDLQLHLRTGDLQLIVVGALRVADASEQVRDRIGQC